MWDKIFLENNHQGAKSIFLLACWSLFVYKRECVDMLIYFNLNLNLIQYVTFFAMEQAVGVTLSYNEWKHPVSQALTKWWLNTELLRCDLCHIVV